MNKLKYTSLIASSILLLTACGSNSSTNDSNTNDLNKVKVISGTVVDGPIKGAKVCFESTNCVETDEQGKYTLQILKTNTSGTITATGGIDTTSGEELKGILKTTLELGAIPNITPATTFVSSLIENGNNLVEAKREVKEYLGLSNEQDINSIEKGIEKKLTALHKAMTSDENLDGYYELANKSKEDRKKQVKEKIEKAEKEVARLFESNIYSSTVKNVYFDANNNGKYDDNEIKENVDEYGVFNLSKFKNVEPTSTGGQHSYFVFNTDDGLSLTFQNTQKEIFFGNGIFITPVTSLITATANRLANKNDINGIGMHNFMKTIATTLGLSQKELYANANTNKKIKTVSDKIIAGLKEKNASYSDLAKALESNPQNIDDLMANVSGEDNVEKLIFTKDNLDIKLNMSGNREDNKVVVISVSPNTKDEYKFFKDEDLTKINKLRIKSGNEKELFKYSVFAGTVDGTNESFKYLDIKLDSSKKSLLKVGDVHTLIVETLDENDKVNGEITLNIEIVIAKIITKDVEVDISKSFPVNSYVKGRKLKSTKEPVLFNLEKTASPYFPERINVIEKSAADLEDITFTMEENKSYKLVRIATDYSGNYYSIVVKKDQTPATTEILKLTAKVLYKDSGIIKEESSSFTFTINNPDNFDYETIKTKIKYDEAKELKLSDESSDDVTPIEEKTPPTLKDYTYDAGYKFYPSSKKIYFEKSKIIVDEGTAADTLSFEIVGGNENSYFKNVEVDWAGLLNINFSDGADIPVGDYTLKLKAKKGVYLSEEVSVTFTLDEIKAPSVTSEVVELNLMNRNMSERKASEDSEDKVTPLFVFDLSNGVTYDLHKFTILESDNGKVALNGVDVNNLTYQGESTNYIVKEFYNYGRSYGLFLKEGGVLTEGEEIVVSATGFDHNGKAYKSKDVKLNFKTIVTDFTLKSEPLSVYISNMIESYDSPKYKYFKLVNTKPTYWSEKSSIYPYEDIGTFKTSDLLEYEIVGDSDTYKIVKEKSTYGARHQLVLKDGKEAKAENLTIKVKGLVSSEDIRTSTFELEIKN